MFYDYSKLAVSKNGSTVIPTAVQVSKDGTTTQIYRLIANGIDIIHKVFRTTITLTLSAIMRVYSDSTTSCGTTTNNGYVENVRLNVSWSASGDKTVRDVRLNFYYVDVYVYDEESNQTRIFDCDVDIDTVTNGETVYLNGTYSEYGTFEYIMVKIQVSYITVTFTDGTSADVEIGAHEITSTIPNPDGYDSTDTFTATHIKNADVREY